MFLKSLMPRAKAWYRWHRNPTVGMFDSTEGVVVKPIIAALFTAFLGGALASHLPWWQCGLVVLASALLGGALGDIKYWLILAGDIQFENELRRRIKGLTQGAEQTKQIVNRHAPHLTDAHAYFVQLEQNLSDLDREWYQVSIGAWVDSALGLMMREPFVLVHILNQVHRHKDAQWQDVSIDDEEFRRTSCNHPQLDPRKSRCSLCYDNLWRELAKPLMK